MDLSNGGLVQPEELSIQPLNRQPLLVEEAFMPNDLFLNDPLLLLHLSSIQSLPVQDAMQSALMFNDRLMAAYFHSLGDPLLSNPIADPSIHGECHEQQALEGPIFNPNGSASPSTAVLNDVSFSPSCENSHTTAEPITSPSHVHDESMSMDIDQLPDISDPMDLGEFSDWVYESSAPGGHVCEELIIESRMETVASSNLDLSTAFDTTGTPAIIDLTGDIKDASRSRCTTESHVDDSIGHNATIMPTVIDLTGVDDSDDSDSSDDLPKLGRRRSRGKKKVFISLEKLTLVFEDELLSFKRSRSSSSWVDGTQMFDSRLIQALPEFITLTVRPNGIDYPVELSWHAEKKAFRGRNVHGKVVPVCVEMAQEMVDCTRGARQFSVTLE